MRRGRAARPRATQPPAVMAGEDGRLGRRRWLTSPACPSTRRPPASSGRSRKRSRATRPRGCGPSASGATSSRNAGWRKHCRLVADHGMRVTGLCRAGMFPAADAAGRRRAVDDGLRAVDEAAALAADCLVVVAGGLPPGSRDLPGARAMIRDALGAILPRARAAGIPVAVEPLHPMYAADRSAINTLAQALDLCDELRRRDRGRHRCLPRVVGPGPLRPDRSRGRSHPRLPRLGLAARDPGPPRRPRQ